MKPYFPHTLATALALLLTTLPGMAQPLDLYTCLDSAAAHMPLVNQQASLNELLKNKLSTYNKAYLPVITLNGQASYQSAVPELPFVMPGTPALDIPKFQYRGYAELYQPLFDAGLANAARISENAQHEVSLMTLELSVHEYKKQVAQLYFQVLLVTDQVQIVNRSLDLLKAREEVLQAAIKQGVAQQNDLLKIQSETITQEKRLDELESAHTSGMEILGLLTGIDTKNRTLAVPDVKGSIDYGFTANPELQLISRRQASIAATEKMILAQRLPRVNAFGQAGIGAPNPYNFFEKDASPYYIAGVRATWNLWDWGKTSRDRKAIGLNRQLFSDQRSQKEMEIQRRVTQIKTEGERLSRALEHDQKIVDLRSEIRKNAAVQVEQGIITSTDYLNEVLAEQLARLTKSVDQISLYQNHVLLQFETGVIQ